MKSEKVLIWLADQDDNFDESTPRYNFPYHEELPSGLVPEEGRLVPPRRRLSSNLGLIRPREEREGLPTGLVLEGGRLVPRRRMSSSFGLSQQEEREGSPTGLILEGGRMVPRSRFASHLRSSRRDELPTGLVPNGLGSIQANVDLVLRPTKSMDDKASQTDPQIPSSSVRTEECYSDLEMERPSKETLSSGTDFILTLEGGRLVPRPRKKNADLNDRCPDETKEPDTNNGNKHGRLSSVEDESMVPEGCLTDNGRLSSARVEDDSTSSHAEMLPRRKSRMVPDGFYSDEYLKGLTI